MKIRSTPPFRHTTVSLLIAAATASLAAHGQELVLDPVVVSGSRVEHKSFDLPASVDVVDQSRIGAAQAKVNVSEALAAVPGITVLNRQNYAQDLQISSRGFGARSAFGVRGIKLITDGIPASTPDGQGQAATFNLDVAERIEVLRGPASALYGNNAGGVVQLFSRNPTGNAVNGSVSAGSYGNVKTDAGIEGVSGKLDYLLDASTFTTDGYRDHSAASRDQAFAKLRYRLDENSRITLVGNSLTQKNTQDPLGLDWQTANTTPRSVTSGAISFNTRKSIDHLQGGATYETRFGATQFQVSAYSGTRSVTQFQSIPKATQQASTKQSGGVIDFNRDFSGLSLRASRDLSLGGGTLTATAGLDLDKSSDDRKGYENFIGNTLGVQGALRRSETDEVNSVDPYVQAEWNKGPWQLSGGVRHSRVAFKVKDRFLSNGDDSGNVSYSKTTPSAGVLYRLSEATNIYASAARGFEAPTLNELFYSGTGGGFSYTLQAATSRHLETGVKTLIGDDTRINAALFRVDTDNELVVDVTSNGRSSYKNASKTLRQGVELGLDTAWRGGFSGRMALTAMSATYEEGFSSKVNGVTTAVPAGKKLPGIPQASFFGEVAWKNGDGLNAGVELVSQGRVYVEDTNNQPAAPGYTVVNLRVGMEQKQGAWQWQEYLRLNNAFDRRYIGSVIVGDGNGRYYEPAPGQNWLIGASVRYRY